MIISSFLLPKLRNYQLKAIEWMINRELHVIKKNEELHPLWRKLISPNGFFFYYNPYIGICYFLIFFLKKDRSYFFKKIYR